MFVPSFLETLADNSIDGICFSWSYRPTYRLPWSGLPSADSRFHFRLALDSMEEHSRPHRHHPGTLPPLSELLFQFPLYIPVVTLVITIGLIVVPAVDDPKTTGVGCGATILFFVIYYVVFLPGLRWKLAHKINGSIMLFRFQCSDVTTKWSQIVFWSIVDEMPPNVEEESDDDEEDEGSLDFETEMDSKTSIACRF